ncbi:hypothetical protein WJM97_22300 [Okeanomitos corallinicola TIOX110]|uniref:Uncharacterized protein n=1 Tax=Okeanomitos corallinicola TIOX110 TaxID=3133117 RepID=A0ABZ2USG2_9CYAN
MSELTLIDLFPGAIETATEITIPKADLNITSPTITADKFIVATVSIALVRMTLEQFEANIDQRVYLSASGFDSFTFKNDGTNQIRHEVRQFSINLARPAPISTLNPEDY